MAPPLVFALACAKLKDASFIGFRGKERISRPYEIDFFFTVPLGTSVKSAVGERATIHGDRKGDGTVPFALHGVVATTSLLHQTKERALYRGLLVPRLWLLKHFFRSFVFTKQKLEEFLSKTLEDGGLATDEFRFDVDKGLYPMEELVTQYRETHLDFFHRWLEREGLYYHFEHPPDGKHEVLVITDHKSHAEPFPGTGRVRYSPRVGDDASASSESLDHLEADTNWLPRSVALTEYDYANPALALEGGSDVTAKGVGTIRDYGYRAFAEKELKRLAKVKAESLGAGESTLRARGGVLGPRPGYKFAVDERPDDVDEDWLAVEVEHMGSVAGMTPETATMTGLSANTVYQMGIKAVPAAIQYRAPQSTAWPRIYGFENGTVCGEADSPYAQLDADGRYLVRLEFDASDLPDGKASTRIRMLQPHGGEKEGFHFPLRKGTEVMIAFLGGDPDRPFIAGVVPNATKPSVVGERNHTQNVIRTGSNNQIVMEDEHGKEFIFMHTPNQRSGIYMGHPAGAHSSVYTGEKDSPSTFNNTQGPANAAPPGKPTPPGALMSVEETASMHMHTEMNQLFFIGGSSTTHIGTGPENTYVGGNVIHGYKGTYGLMVGQATEEFYYSTRATTTFAARTDKVMAGGMTQEITDSFTQTVHGPLTQVVDGVWDAKVGAAGAVHLEANGGTLTITAKTKILLDAPEIELHGGQKIYMHAPAVKSEADGKWEVKTPKHWQDALAVSFDGYLSKNAFGVEKFDMAAISAAVTGYKREATALAMANTMAKQESVWVGKSFTALKIDDVVCRKQQVGMECTDEMIKACNGAVMTVCKAFLKL